MLRRRIQSDYQPVTPSGRQRERGNSTFAAKPAVPAIDRFSAQEKTRPADDVPGLAQSGTILLKRGHALSYAFLFAFTLVLYARPAEFYPSPLTSSIAFILALIMLACYIPAQLALEGNLTSRPREVNLVLLFCLAGLMSIPLALNRGVAWEEFTGPFIRCIVVFIAMVNVVRTKARLKGLLLLALATGVWLSLGAINDYRLGLSTVEGYRVTGRGSGIFGNPNDMALFLVTVAPVAVALACDSKRLAGKLFYAGSAILMFIAIALTYSRGGFLGLVVALAFFAWRVSPRRRGVLIVGGCLAVAAFLVLVPGYSIRLISIVFPSLDPVGSSDARRGELFRSIYVALRHPLLGVGMGNYASEMSHRGQVTHNAYTHVAAEMGMAALVCYTMFIVTPLRKLGQIVRETFGVKPHSHYFYLAIGLQASLLGYMVSSFFASVAYLWYVYYLIAYAVCLRRLYESETGREVVVKKRSKASEARMAPVISDHRGVAMT
ncbi:MAG TPA: O-antigen ligase family protein [Pyrinomonadaceae bacterium]|nr:O-antigen ligase family protein [Pyrinomonadaceae bacterium]